MEPGGAIRVLKHGGILMQDLLAQRRLTRWQTVQLLWHLPTLLRLLGRLMGDGRVMGWAKALFVGALLFIVSPFDVPNYVPLLGEVSDVVLALLACRWFLAQCPAELVAGHLAAIRMRGAPVEGSHPVGQVVGRRL
jgi:uncharacterized membrane protein YkvA (DUF1232 family)